MTDRRILRARITGVGLWTPGFANIDAAACGRPAEPGLRGPKAEGEGPRPAVLSAGQPVRQDVGARVRRGRDAGPGADVAQVAAVFGSALGETEVMLKLLDQMRPGAG